MWLVYAILEFTFIFAIRDWSKRPFPVLSFSFHITLYILFFYTCVYIIGDISKKRSNALVLLGIAVLGVLFSLVSHGSEYLFEVGYFNDLIIVSENPWPWLYVDITHFTNLALFSFAFIAYLKAIESEKSKTEINKKLLKTEIGFLRAQINPHFLFNTLNFLYNDISKISKEDGEVIISLTKLLRFSVESSKTEVSTLGKELDMVEEFISLQRAIVGNKLSIYYTKEANLLMIAFPPAVLLKLAEIFFSSCKLSTPLRITAKADRNQFVFSCEGSPNEAYLENSILYVDEIETLRKGLDSFFLADYSFSFDYLDGLFILILAITWKKD